MNVSSGVKINEAEGENGELDFSKGENCLATFNVVARERESEREGEMEK